MAQCPACHSASVQRLAMVRAAGISSTSTHVVGRIDGDFVHGHAYATQQTLLSRMAAKPRMQTHQKISLTICGVICFIVALAVFYHAGANGLFWIFIAGGVVSIAWSRSKFIADWDKDAAALHEQYARTFMCHACGHRFIPALQ